MGSVYSNSACAFIWLGPGDQDSDRALSFIGSLRQMFFEHKALHDDGDYDLMGLIADMGLPSDAHTWAELEALFSRPWFHRSWTFQEPILAPNRMIACGSKIRGWHTFHIAVTICFHFRCREKTYVSVFPFMLISWISIEKAEDLRLSMLIYVTRYRETSDPRDKVYALYGLLRGYQKVPLEINYAMSVEDVYRSTVRFCIENEGSLSVLTHVSEFENISDFPSWVPDWRDESRLGCTPVDTTGLQDFHASSMSRPLLVPSFSSDQLTLKGFILAIVVRTINVAALRVNTADSSPDSWITNAAAAGVPVRFLQGKMFQTSYDLTITLEHSAFHRHDKLDFARSNWPESVKWVAAGHPDPIPQAVLREYTETFDQKFRNRLLFLTEESLGLAPASTQVGDRVCILLGGKEPFILRPHQNTARTTPCREAKPKHQSTSKSTPQGIKEPTHQGSRESARAAKQSLETTEWTLMGDCYLHGYMDGEAMETVTEADYVNFTLV